VPGVLGNCCWASASSSCRRRVLCMFRPAIRLSARRRHLHTHVQYTRRARAKLHYTDTGTDTCTNGQAHNNSTTNLPHRNARALPNISTRQDVGMWQFLSVRWWWLFVAGVRSWCPCIVEFGSYSGSASVQRSNPTVDHVLSHNSHCNSYMISPTPVVHCSPSSTQTRHRCRATWYEVLQSSNESGAGL